jgi:hypothetical protein
LQRDWNLILFESLLHRHEEERHSRILARPSLWDRVLRDDDGFLSPARAAEAMGVTEEEVVALARRGLLLWREVGGEIRIQPAIVSTLAVRDESEAA